MILKNNYENIDIDGLSVAEAIAALQAWETENPEATDSTFRMFSDEESAYAEISFSRPYTQKELEQIKAYEQRDLENREKQERQTYERLKEKYGD